VVASYVPTHLGAAYRCAPHLSFSFLPNELGRRWEYTDVNDKEVLKLLFQNSFPSGSPASSNVPAAVVATMRRAFTPSHLRSASMDGIAPASHARGSLGSALPWSHAPAVRSSLHHVDADGLSSPSPSMPLLPTDPSTATLATALSNTMPATARDGPARPQTAGVRPPRDGHVEGLSPPTSQGGSPAHSPPRSRSSSLRGNQAVAAAQSGGLGKEQVAVLQQRLQEIAHGNGAVASEPSRSAPSQPPTPALAGLVVMGSAQAEAFARPRRDSTVASAYLPAAQPLTPAQINSQLVRASREALINVACTIPSTFVNILCQEKLLSKHQADRVGALKLISMIARKVCDRSEGWRHVPQADEGGERLCRCLSHANSRVATTCATRPGGHDGGGGHQDFGPLCGLERAGEPHGLGHHDAARLGGRVHDHRL